MKLQKLLEQQATIAAAINAERQAQRERKKELVLKLAEKVGLFDLDPKQIADALQKAANSVAVTPPGAADFFQPRQRAKGVRPCPVSACA